MIQKHVYYLTIMYRYVKFKNVYHLESTLKLLVAFCDSTPA